MEHYSSEEGTPKEGYLNRKSAIEAMHVMEYKYNTTFRVYQCSVCGKFHIGRVKTLVENEKAISEVE